ncbi:hypothetical protein Q1695_009774 [Nippostrongylus brasiliensis]|nr:hypothetical protein Q1695_009774 [Nippostrongylus brasiliensis]
MLLVLLVATLLPSVTATCSYNSGNLTSRWQVVDGKITIELENKNIGKHRRWTSIGFGPNMEKMEVVLVKIVDSVPTMVTGHTTGYSEPTYDSVPSVELDKLSYKGRRLVLRFSRPLGANGPRKHSLEQCQKWNFAKEGIIFDDEVGTHTEKPPQVEICPKQCTKKIFHD